MSAHRKNTCLRKTHKFFVCLSCHIKSIWTLAYVIQVYTVPKYPNISFLYLLVQVISGGAIKQVISLEQSNCPQPGANLTQSGLRSFLSSTVWSVGLFPIGMGENALAEPGGRILLKAAMWRSQLICMIGVPWMARVVDMVDGDTWSAWWGEAWALRFFCPGRLDRLTQGFTLISPTTTITNTITTNNINSTTVFRHYDFLAQTSRNDIPPIFKKCVQQTNGWTLFCWKCNSSPGDFFLFTIIMVGIPLFSNQNSRDLKKSSDVKDFVPSYTSFYSMLKYQRCQKIQEQLSGDAWANEDIKTPWYLFFDLTTIRMVKVICHTF